MLCPVGLVRLPTDSSRRSIASRCSIASREGHSGGFWVTESGWNVRKLLELSDTMRAALAKGRKLTPAELDDLNFVLDMMVR